MLYNNTVNSKTIKTNSIEREWESTSENLSLIALCYARIHTYICIYEHTYTHTYIHTYMHTYIHTCMHTYIHTYSHANIYIYTDSYVTST